MTLQVTVVVGNPKPRSRTLQVAEALVHALFGRDGQAAVEIIDLADHLSDVFDWQSASMDALSQRVASSDLVVFASPTYKATYTGLLKAFLDRYPANGLAGVVAIPLLTGADQSHSMGPTVNLAPLLVELGASVPGRGFYFVTGRLDELDDLVRAAASEYAANLKRLAGVAAALPASPEPALPIA
jgi:FMN reductase